MILGVQLHVHCTLSNNIKLEVLLREAILWQLWGKIRTSLSGSEAKGKREAMEKAVREIKEFGSVQVTLRAQWGPSKGSDFKTSCAMMTSTGRRYFDYFKANLMSQDSQQECEFCDWCQRQWEKQHHAGSRPRTLCREQANEALLPYSGLCSKGESSSGDTDHPEK